MELKYKMTNKEVDYTTIRIKNDVKNELDKLKIENETYSVVISQLLKDNERIKQNNKLLLDLVNKFTNEN